MVDWLYKTVWLLVKFILIWSILSSSVNLLQFLFDVSCLSGMDVPEVRFNNSYVRFRSWNMKNERNRSWRLKKLYLILKYVISFQNFVWASIILNYLLGALNYWDNVMNLSWSLDSNGLLLCYFILLKKVLEREIFGHLFIRTENIVPKSSQ
jgi:hypothetical protein